jgi:hypothetical protein
MRETPLPDKLFDRHVVRRGRLLGQESQPSGDVAP